MMLPLERMRNERVRRRDARGTGEEVMMLEKVPGTRCRLRRQPLPPAESGQGAREELRRPCPCRRVGRRLPRSWPTPLVVGRPAVLWC